MPSYTVGTPCLQYKRSVNRWAKNRAICEGEQATKEFDNIIDLTGFNNILIPFSDTMSSDQYNLLKSEAELPGITAQYLKTLIGGLLRKPPVLDFKVEVPEGTVSWLTNNFSVEYRSLSSFLFHSLLEELQTSRGWIYVDHSVEIDGNPYPVLWKAEDIINWRVGPSSELEMVIIRDSRPDYTDSEFHPKYVEIIKVHEIYEGFYRTREFEASTPTEEEGTSRGTFDYQLIKIVDTYIKNNERLTKIPVYPLNGSVDISPAFVQLLVDKEIALYNKFTRRNHLLYGAATYTPVVYSDMSDDRFEEIVDSGLGSWLHLGKDDRADILKTPTEALADMDRSIASGIEEMAKLGVRMASSEVSQSGVALEIRNASQTASMGLLNMYVSNTIKSVIAFMIDWKHNIRIEPNDIIFQLSVDFNPTPLGADWLRLATEWYEAGKIPRSSWISLVKANELLDSSYDDVEGMKEIAEATNL